MQSGLLPHDLSFNRLFGSEKLSLSSPRHRRPHKCAQRSEVGADGPSQLSLRVVTFMARSSWGP
eukprot:6448919-Pyramimonas_sp.AAC.1